MRKIAVILSAAAALFLLLFLSAGKRENALHPAEFWNVVRDGIVQCLLCPRKCILPEGARGVCESRINKGGSLYTLTYGRPVAVHVDPIEKKPFFHVVPGAPAFSIATAGCNMRCLFCQNWQISQADPGKIVVEYVSPEQIVDGAIKNKCDFIVYTYTEPTVFYEYMIETSRLAKKKGLKNAMHSCGYINQEPLKELLKYMDAVNIDLKGFTRDFYQKMGLLAELEPVLDALKTVHEAGVWLEITNLLIPGENDAPEDIKKMCLWIKKNLGADTPLHFSRFYPAYKLENLPPTPLKTLEEARRIARAAGLRYVYIGNIPGNEAENTRCPFCRELLVRRIGYKILKNNIVGGKCRFCGRKIAGIWDIKEPPLNLPLKKGEKGRGEDVGTPE